MNEDFLNTQPVTPDYDNEEEVEYIKCEFDGQYYPANEMVYDELDYNYIYKHNIDNYINDLMQNSDEQEFKELQMLRLILINQIQI